MDLQTNNLKLVPPDSLEDVRAMIDSMDPAEKAEVSADWLEMLNSATEVDPWIHGFSVVLLSSDEVVGQAGFKGPPTAHGIVEIAYGIAPEHQGKGYATETAEALTVFAFESDRVRIVRAHTLPESNASPRVLTKCGFQNTGEATDPEDGRVWRWEKQKKSLE